MNRSLSPTDVFRNLVVTLRDHGAPDAYQAALSMLAGMQRGDSPKSDKGPVPQADLRPLLEQATSQLSEILDWVSVSDTARRRGERR